MSSDPLTKHRVSCCRPQKPEVMFRRADLLRRRLGGDRFFNRPGLSWLREAWTLGKFGSEIRANNVELAPIDPPDGYVRVRRSRLPVEITEALDPDRRRGRDYKLPVLGVQTLGQELLMRHERDYVDWVAAAANRKIDRRQNLPPGTIVLIHLSAWLFFVDRVQIEERLWEAVPEPPRGMAGFCVLHSGDVYIQPSLAALLKLTAPLDRGGR